MSLYTRTVVATINTTGLVPTLFVGAYDINNDVLVFPTNFIIENPTFTYTSQFTNFDASWSGQILWTVSNTVVFQEDFTGTVTTPFDIPFTSYLTLEEANLYFSTRLNTDPWDNATASDQMKALTQATRQIDRLNFVGIQAVCGQPLQWPRIIGPRQIGVVAIPCTPSDIPLAVCEIALNLLDGVDPDLEDELLNSQSDAYATVRITSDSKVARDHIKAGIVSITAWRYLLPWLQDPRAMTLRKG